MVREQMSNAFTAEQSSQIKSSEILSNQQSSSTNVSLSRNDRMAHPNDEYHSVQVNK